LFLECSAKSATNVDAVCHLLTQVFLTLADSVLKRIEKKEINPTNESIGVKLGNVREAEEQGCRC